MKRKLQLGLAVILGLMASVGWLRLQAEGEAQKDLKITTDLVGAQVGKPIIFGISTFPTAGVTTTDPVRFEIGLSGTDAATLEAWKLEYYEPNKQPADWMKWNPENNTYVFGPQTGFPLQTATSYFKMTPTTKGTYSYTLTAKKVATNEIVATEAFELTVADGFPINKMGAVGMGSNLYSSVATAVNFAEEGNKLSLSSGNFVLSPGTKEVQGQKGWYLPIDKKGLIIEGQGIGEGGTSLVPDQTIVPNTILSSQDFITVLSDNVTLQNMTIVTKLEANKVVEVLGKNVILNNLEFTRLGSEDGASYAGSIYFDPSDKDAGTVSLTNLRLYNGRISFTGANKGNVTLNNIWIEYKDLKIADRVLTGSTLQDYPPFGAINNKPDLKINGHESVKVVLHKSDAKYYQLDATTVANMPAEAVLSLTSGTFELSSQLVIDKPIVLSGSGAQDGKPQTILKAKAGANWPADNSKKNLVSIEGKATGTAKIVNLFVVGSTASGINAQSAMDTKLINVGLQDNANAGLLVHSKVNAEGLNVMNNGWGGVNVDKSGKTSALTPFFEFDKTSFFTDQSKIWSEDITSDPTTLVKVPNDTWSSYVGVQGTNESKMRYWTNSTLKIDESIYADSKAIFANGKSITITEPAAGKVKIAVDGTSEALEFNVSDNVIVFGGSKYANVDTTKITMNSGKVVRVFGGGYLGNVKVANVTVNGGEITKTLTGGGYGPKAGFTASNKTADVTSKVNLKVSNAKVYYLISAGMEYARTAATEVVVNNTDITYALGGGYAPVDNDQSLNKDFASTSNNVATSNFTVKGGSVSGAICAGGGYSFSYIKDATARIENVIFNGGLYGAGWNGSTDKSVVTVSGCSFNKKNADYNTIAALIRGKAGEVTMTFDDKCTFDSKYECYLGADRDNEYDPAPASAKTTVTFNGGKSPIVKVSEGMQDVFLNGAKVSVDVFVRKVTGNVTVNTFTVPEGKIWSFPAGMTVANGCTLTNSGTLVIPAANVMAGIAAGGDLLVAATYKDILAVMNDASSKDDLSSKAFTITCNDGVIAPTAEKAKELLKAGKNAMLLSFADNTYSIKVYSITQAKITNLPDSVVFGTAPVTLAFNLANTEVSINGSTSEVVSLEKGVLTILKPGTVVLDLKVKKDSNADGKIDGNDSGYDDDAASTQTLKVTKRKVTLTAGLTATTKDYNGTKAITLTKGALTFSGKRGADATGLGLSVFSGELLDANAGENKPVVVTATLAGDGGKDSTAYYELAPITFVKAKVEPKAVTVSAANIAEYKYGSEIPAFTVTYSPALIDGDKLDGILKFNCSATKESLVKEGGYDIMPYGLTSNNYAITFAKGTLTVNAVEPQIEMVEAKTVINDSNRDIQVKAKLIDKGGAAENAGVEVTFNYGSSPVNATLTEGYYTATIANPGANTYAITASAKVDSKTGTSKGINVTIDAKTLQHVTFGKAVQSTMVYGNDITLSATSDQAAATGAYTYKVESVTGGATITDDGKLKATKTGKVTLTVTRVADADYSAASAIQTIEVTPKPIMVKVGEIKKTYDGTTAISQLPTFTLEGVLTGDDVTLNTSSLSLSYANKNVADKVNVLMPVLALTGDAAANYALVQPTAVAGKIEKAPLTVKVKDVARMWNQRYTKYEFEATGLQNDEPLNVAYTGALEVTESGENLNLKMDQAKCLNYALTTQSGKLTVDLGTPVAVVYGMNTSEAAVSAFLIDPAGYTDLTVKTVVEDQIVYALIMKGDKQVGRSFNSITLTGMKSFSMPTTKAAGDWNDTGFKQIAYRATGTETITEGATFMSSNPNVLTVELSSGKANEITYKAVGTGKATIVVVTGTETKIKNYEIAPKALTYTASMDKAYDGTTQATGVITLTDVAGEDVALDIENVTFNFAAKTAGTTTILASQQPILTGSAANNYTLTANVTGKIVQKELEVKTVTAYYNGANVITLSDYTSTGLISGDVVPVKATFADAKVGSSLSFVALATTGDVANYTLKTVSPTGTILKSTVIATLPTDASSPENLKGKIKLAIRETGESVTATAIGFAPVVSSEGSGSNTVYYVNGGATDNYSVVYDKNQLGFKSDPTPPGPSDVTVTGVSLDKSELTLPRLETYTLKATVTPDNATNAAVKWTSSDETIATVDANGKVTAVKVGKATITVTTVDGGFKATCEVTVDFATGMEEDLANTSVMAKNGMIYINPMQPLQATIVSMNGKAVYDARINGATQIAVVKGVYIVKLTNAGSTITTKISVF